MIQIIEALENANCNLQNNTKMGFVLAKDQLKNAVILLRKGYSLYDEIEPLLEEYEDVENVPEKEEGEE